MEIRDLVDKNRKLAGITIEKGQEIPKGKYIQIVFIYIENTKGEILVQKRTKQKNGKYGLTAGHLISKENSLEGILREIQEEIGLKLTEDDIELIFSKKTDEDFVDVYYMQKDIEIKELKLQKEEVDFVKWMTLDEIEELYKEGEFIPSHRRSIKQCIECIKYKSEE